MTRPTKAIIDLDALQINFETVRRTARHAKLLAVVKADAYGHGAIIVAKTLEAHVPAFGVACIEEALTLRQAGVVKPILLLQGPMCADEVAVSAANDFWLMVENARQIEMIDLAGPVAPLRVWLKVDTGMHRLGFQDDEVRKAYSQLKRSANVCNEIILSTHFSSAGCCECEHTEKQIARMGVNTSGLDGPRCMANSAGIINHKSSHADWVRAGILLYGIAPFAYEHPIEAELKPVMRLSSAVTSIRRIAAGEFVGYDNTWRAARDSIVATVPIGYADGYPRSAANGTPVSVDGTIAPLVGRVSMDMITVDVTNIDSATIGSNVELWGPNLPVRKIAESAGTISYELLARVSSRVTRRFVRGPHTGSHQS